MKAECTYMLAGLAPCTIVRLSRLNLAIRIVTRCEGDLHRLLFAARASVKSWLHALEDDFRWLQQLSGAFQEYRVPARWFHAFRCTPKALEKLIKATCHTPEANALSLNELATSTARLGIDWRCDLCGKGFASRCAMKSQ